MSGSASRIEYSEKYADEENEYRYVHNRLRVASPEFNPLTIVSLIYLLRLWIGFSSLMIGSHVILPKDVAKTLPKSRLLTEQEWRGIGVQQSRGWQHYAIHRPEPHILLFRRPLGTDPQNGRVDPTLRAQALEEYKNQFGLPTAVGGAAKK
jgi:cyclin-dependent kinase regulatory subunit CKS1